MLFLFRIRLGLEAMHVIPARIKHTRCKIALHACAALYAVLDACIYIRDALRFVHALFARRSCVTDTDPLDQYHVSVMFLHGGDVEDERIPSVLALFFCTGKMRTLIAVHRNST